MGIVIREVVFLRWNLNQIFISIRHNGKQTEKIL